MFFSSSSFLKYKILLIFFVQIKKNYISDVFVWIDMESPQSNPRVYMHFVCIKMLVILGGIGGGLLTKFKSLEALFAYVYKSSKSLSF